MSPFNDHHLLIIPTQQGKALSEVGNSATLTSLSYHTRTQFPKDTFLALFHISCNGISVSGLYPLKIIFYAEITSLFSVEEAFQFWDKIHSLHVGTWAIWAGLLISPWNICVLKSWREEKKMCCISPNRGFEFISSLSSFLSETSILWILLCDLKTIWAYWFQHQKLFA